MMREFVPLETHVWRAPLGLRFLDLVSGRGVTDGLIVTAGQWGATETPRQAVLSPIAGIYGFRSLPGLRAYEAGERPASDWCAPFTSPPDALLPFPITESGSAPANFTVSVSDARGRFLPQTLLLCLPREQVLEVPLFSAPTRPPPAGTGAIRGELWDATTNAPAAWAFLTATLGGDTYAAVTDSRGVFAMFVPYAAVLPPTVGSPPHGAASLDQLTWPVTLRVFSGPASPHAPLGVIPPDIRMILRQGAALIHDGPVASGGYVVRSIRFGSDLVVATAGDARLRVESAVTSSPP